MKLILLSILPLLFFSVGLQNAFADHTEGVIETADNDLYLQTDKLSYSEGETIFISGSIADTINIEYPIVIKIIYKEAYVHLAQLQVASDYTFTETVLAEGALWETSGAYTITAAIGNEIVETTFSYTSPSNPSCGSGTVFDLDTNLCMLVEEENDTPDHIEYNEPTFTFENKTYTQNDIITITGNTPRPEKVFHMDVYNPDNRIVAYWDTLSDYDANLSDEFDLSTLGDFYTAIYPERVINGTYTIIGDFGWGYDDYIKTFEFLYIIDRDHALENITGSFSKESYYKDDERVVLTVTTSEGYFSSIFNTELQDSNGNMIHKISEIINGDGEFTTSFYISNLPTSGNYTILLDTHSIYEPLEFYFQYTDFTLHNSQLNTQIQKAHQEIDYLKNELALMNETIISLQSSISEILEFIQ